ncbi:MAG TPA: FG-GAP-like repeat-containing protein [Parafilimonas sp.]|nr:FG-GAP-like repeat-containing protein [Parafilimonas sp.]
MKKLLYVGLLSCIVISCTKEKSGIYGPKNNDAITHNSDTLYPAGVIPDDPSLVEKIGYYVTDSRALRFPSSVDLSNKMPAVRSQGNQGSCVGWAVGYYCKTYQEVVERGWNANTNAYSPSWVYNQINGGKDNGSKVADAMNLLADDGCDFWDNFPYSAADHTTQPDGGSIGNAKHYKASSWKYVKKEVDDIKSLLASGKVVVISFDIHPDFDDLDEDNEVYDDFSDSSRGSHAVCVVGYDDNREAFKLVNSWGRSWGINGYGWIAYDVIPDINKAYVLTDKPNVYDTKYLIGDFDADKVQDIFTTNLSAWYVSWGGTTGLKKINTWGSGGDFKLGDFNGDGKADVFYADGSQWRVAYSGTGKWKTINIASEKTNLLALGDFNGDGKSDVFFANGSQWKVSYSGTGKWTIINTASENTGKLALGDFNADGKADVFYADGSQWKVSYSGTGKYVVINTSGEITASLKLGDFNADGKSDVFYANGSEWKVSYSGTSKYTVINTAIETTGALNFGDFNKDGKSDVFHALTSSWRVSWSGSSRWKVL